MKLIKLQEQINKLIEKGYGEKDVFMNINTHTRDLHKTLENFYKAEQVFEGFDWDEGNIFIHFEDTGDYRPRA